MQCEKRASTGSSAHSQVPRVDNPANVPMGTARPSVPPFGVEGESIRTIAAVALSG